MKDDVMSCYNSPKVEVIKLNQEDVICTSLLSIFNGKLLKKSWVNEWIGMETQSLWEGLD